MFTTVHFQTSFTYSLNSTLKKINTANTPNIPLTYIVLQTDYLECAVLHRET